MAFTVSSPVLLDFIYYLCYNHLNPTNVGQFFCCALRTRSYRAAASRYSHSRRALPCALSYLEGQMGRRRRLATRHRHRSRPRHSVACPYYAFSCQSYRLPSYVSHRQKQTHPQNPFRPLPGHRLLYHLRLRPFFHHHDMIILKS